jgi:hypothetical protein
MSYYGNRPMAPRDRQGYFIRPPPPGPPVDPFAAAYQAGEADADADADAQRFGYENTSALNPSLMDTGPSRRGSGYAEPDYRSLPRRPPIYPPRRIRRASTLPVRFEDQAFEDERLFERGSRLAPPLQPAPRHRPLRGDITTSHEPARRVYFESPKSSDSETEPKEHHRERVVDVAEEGEPEVIVDRSRERAVIDVNPRSRSRSRSYSPVYRSRYEVHERERHVQSQYEEWMELEREQRHGSRPSPQYQGELDLKTEQEAYPSILSRHRKSFLTRDSTAGSLSDISEKESVPASQSPGSISQAGKYLHVFRSQYTVEGSTGGYQSAKLRISEDTTQGTRKSSHCLFKWV